MTDCHCGRRANRRPQFAFTTFEPTARWQPALPTTTQPDRTAFGATAACGPAAVRLSTLASVPASLGLAKMSGEDGPDVHQCDVQSELAARLPLGFCRPPAVNGARQGRANG